MTTYSDALSTKAKRRLNRQYGFGAARYVAVASWRTMAKAAYYYLRGSSPADALFKANHPAQLHYGVWDKKDVSTFDDAIRRATKVAFQEIFPNYADENVNLVHLGSGFGGADIQLSKEHINLSTTGINIDKTQTEISNRLASLENQASRTHFIEDNFLSLKTSFKKKFDGGIAMESICHVPASQLSILWLEISKMLKPSARFVIHDWFLAREPRGDEKTQLDVFLRGWDLPNCVTVNEMKNAAEKGNISLVSNKDMTPFILKSARKIHFRAVLLKPLILLAQNKKSNRLNRLSLSDPSTIDFANTCLVQKYLFEDSLITYRQLVFLKKT